jgi:hypothetical protein
MKLFGENTEISKYAKLIINEDIDGIKQAIEEGWNTNEVFEICKYISEPPIILALYYNKLKVVDFLIKNGVNLKRYPVIPAAADCCSIETIKLLLKYGADLYATNNVGSNALHRAVISERYNFIQDLIDLGIDIKKDGVLLRKSVYNKQYEVIRILLNNGIDVNLHTPDMVFPYNSTPILVAAENNDFDTVKLLVENGADVTIKNDYGERPFLAALKNKNKEMIDYLKALEPEDWHNEEQRIYEFKKLKMPEMLINYLRQKDMKLKINDNKFVSYVTFHSVIACKKVDWNGNDFWDLLSDVDNYSPEGFLVWYPKKKCLASADYEHENFKILGKWEEFIKNPSMIIDKIFE